MTRGDGGQNEIGPELFQAIGILRSEELAGVHRYDNADQYFTRAYEFGYSFSVEETFETWGKEPILADVVKVIRMTRPDILLTMNRDGQAGGQHHMGSARLAGGAAPQRPVRISTGDYDPLLGMAWAQFRTARPTTPSVSRHGSAREPARGRRRFVCAL